MKKRILIFSLAFKPFFGGAEIAIKEITDRMSPEEFDFDMVTLRLDRSLPKYEKIGNVGVHRIGFTKENPNAVDLVKLPMYLNKVFFPVMAFFKAAFLDRKKRYHAFWCMMSYMGFPAVLFNWFYRRIPIILTLQEGDSIEHVTRRARIRMVFPIYLAVFRKASVVQVISNYLGRFARDMGYKGRIEVIPNAVNTKLFSTKPQAQILDDLKRKLGKGENDVFIITTSRLVPKNGVGHAIEALKYLPENYKFLVLGIGPLEEPLKSMVYELALDERVIFLGELDQLEIPKYLHISDIFLRPSLSEGMGNSFIEAMAARVPVVATSVGGIRDFLTDKVTGFVCRAADPRDIAETVKYLMNEKGLRAKVVENAFQLAMHKYDWNLIAKEMRGRVFEKI